MRVLFYFFLTLIYVENSHSIIVKHQLNAKSGYCQPNRWYSMGPCQQCYCQQKNVFICDSNDLSKSTKIWLGSEKLTLCVANLNKQMEEILGGYKKRSQRTLRGGSPSASDESDGDVKLGIDSAASDSESEESGNKLRMRLHYPSVGDDPKNAPPSESDESDEGSEDNADNSRKFNTKSVSTMDDITEKTPKGLEEHFDLSMKVKEGSDIKNNMDLTFSVPKELMILLTKAHSKKTNS